MSARSWFAHFHWEVVPSLHSPIQLSQQNCEMDLSGILGSWFLDTKATPGVLYKIFNDLFVDSLNVLTVFVTRLGTIFLCQI